MTSHILDKLTKKEQQHLEVYGIVTLLNDLIEEDSTTLELILATAGPQVCLQITTIYEKFMKGDCSLPVKLGIAVRKTADKVDILIETERDDKIADTASPEKYKDLITDLKT
jgi:hypothetical protein